MGEAKVRWAGSRTFIGTDSTCHAVLMSNAEDNVGMKASELMLVSLACCSSFDVVGILEKRKVVLRKLEVEVSAEQEKDPPWTFTDIRLKYIPREIMEANRTEVQFFEAGILNAELVIKDDKVDVKLTHFAPSLAEAPEKELTALRERAVTSPFDFIDFWAVDFEWREGKPFEHHWQDFRTRKDRSLKTQSDFEKVYKEKGEHLICVKVIDVFGIDTTTVIQYKG